MLHRILFALSALALVLALSQPATLSKQQNWFLLDASPSVGSHLTLEDYLALGKIADFDNSLLLDAASSKRLRKFPDKDWLDTKDLASALSKMSSEVPSGSKLYVFSDGRALSRLNDDILNGVNVAFVQLHDSALIRHIACPTYFDGSSKLQIDILLNSPIGSATSISVETAQELLSAPRFDYISELHLRLELQPQATAADFEFDILLDGTTLQHLTVKHSKLPQLKIVMPPIDAEQLQQLLDSGISCAIGYPQPSSLQQLKAPLNPFTVQQQQLPTVVCLLDTSGSMDGNGLNHARSALREVLKKDLAVELLIYPFNSSLLPPLAAVEQLDDLRAFGATDIANVISKLAQLNLNPQRLLILSDGQSQIPEGGWRPQMASLFANAQISVLPCTVDAQIESLQQLGELVVEGELLERLQQQLDAAAQTDNSDGHLLNQQFFTAAQTFTLDQAHPVFDAALDANVLYADAANHPLLCVDFFDGARLYSMAGTISNNQYQQLSAIEQSLSQTKKWRMTKDGLLIYSANVPRIIQNGITRPLHLSDATADNNLFVADVSPLYATELHLPGLAQPISIQPSISSEFSSSTLPFLQWLNRRDQAFSEINVFALFCALSLFLGGYFVYHRAYDD